MVPGSMDTTAKKHEIPAWRHASLIANLFRASGKWQRNQRFQYHLASHRVAMVVKSQLSQGRKFEL
jgi:hypothetical protein